MRPRYIARLGADAPNGPAPGSAPARGSVRFRRVRLPGLALDIDPSTPMLTADDEKRGVLIGTLYRRRDAHPVDRLEPELIDEALASQGESVVERFWGAYVLIGRGPGSFVVLRDPSGAIPAYHFAAAGAAIICSDAAVVASSSPLSRAVDEEFLRQWLTYPYLRTARTGLSGVQELLPGQALIGCGEQVRPASAWTPWRFAARDRRPPSLEEAGRALRRELLRTVPRQIGPAERILLQLSGGLDSSIVAAALTAAGRPFEAITYHTRSPDGDERHYARLVAQRCGAPLAELVEEDGPACLSPTARAGFRPSRSPVLAPLRAAISQAAQAAGADVLVDGGGGDNLFCYLTSAAPAVDAAAVLGPGAALGTLIDLAGLTGSTMWAALRAALAKRRRARRRPPWKRDEMFLAPDGLANAADDHPWLEPPRTALPGTREHVEALVSVRHFLDLEDDLDGARPAHPLLAQPLVELCLGIPSWLWLSGGRDRAVARSAFADLLPRAILDRRSKGRLESLFVRVFAASRGELRALLLDGRLRSRGLLDGPAIEAYLAQPGDPADQHYVRLFHFAALELWLSSIGR